MSKEIKEIESDDQIEIVAKNDEKLEAFIEDDEQKVESDTISRNLFKDKTAAFNLNDRK